MKEGVNARSGQVTLTAGGASVNMNPLSATNSRIFLSRASIGANAGDPIGLLSVENVIANTSFDIVALDPSDASVTIATDISVVNYFIIEAT